MSILNDIKKIVLFSHGHKHFPVLQKFSINENGKIYFDGKEIKGSEINSEAINKIYENVSLKKVADSDFLFLINNTDNKIKKINKEFINFNIDKINLNIAGKAIMFGGASNVVYGYKNSETITHLNTIETFLFDTNSNSHVFGRLQEFRVASTSFSNSVKCIVVGGFSYYNTTASVSKNHEKTIFSTEANSVICGVDIATNAGSEGKIFPVSFSYDLVGTYLCGNTQSYAEQQNFATEAVFSSIEFLEYKNSCSFSTQLKGYVVGGFSSGTTTCKTAFAIGHSNFSVSNLSIGNILSESKSKMCACSDNKKAIFFGGIDEVKSSYFKNIEYINLQSLASAVNCGSLDYAAFNTSATSDSKKAVITGGAIVNVMIKPTNTIEYIEFATLATKKDFGDLVVAKNAHSASSNTHGGLTI